VLYFSFFFLCRLYSSNRSEYCNVFDLNFISLLNQLFTGLLLVLALVEVAPPLLAVLILLFL
jgi:hypothetical protein